jgi:hypothetical protein
VPERTPAEAYTARRQAIDAKLERLRAVLATFDTWHREKPNDWSIVGDLGAVESALDQILVGCEAAEIWQREGWGRTGGTP